jgi:ribosome-binding factor A
VSQSDAARTRKLSVRVREIVASVVEHQIKDDRLGLVTITDCRMTADLHNATVFWTVWGDDTTRADSAAALESAKGLIRSAVGRATGLKHTPSIEFVLDAVPENAHHIEELLARVRDEDERLHQAAQQAVPAGEPDPYKSAPDPYQQ